MPTDRKYRPSWKKSRHFKGIWQLGNIKNIYMNVIMRLIYIWGGMVRRGFSNSAEFQQLSRMIVRLLKMQTGDSIRINKKLLKSGFKVIASNASPWETFSKWNQRVWVSERTFSIQSRWEFKIQFSFEELIRTCTFKGERCNPVRWMVNKNYIPLERPINFKSINTNL